MFIFFFAVTSIYPPIKKKECNWDDWMGEGEDGLCTDQLLAFLTSFNGPISTVAQDQPKELFISHGDDTNSLGIIPPETLRQRLDGHTTLHKVIKTNISSTPHIILCHNHLDSRIGEVVSECTEGLFEFVSVDGPGPVEIVVLETGFPFLDVVPEPDEFVE